MLIQRALDCESSAAFRTAERFLARVESLVGNQIRLRPTPILALGTLERFLVSCKIGIFLLFLVLTVSIIIFILYNNV